MCVRARALVFILRQPMRHQRIGVAVAHSVLLLQPGDMLHVFGRRAGIGRFLFALVSIALCGLGWAWAVLDRDRQFLHDRIAGTRLVELAKPVKKVKAASAA